MHMPSIIRTREATITTGLETAFIDSRIGALFIYKMATRIAAIMPAAIFEI